MLFAHRFHQMHPQKPQQQRPDHVLVHRVEPCPAIHQIKGHFRKQCKQQQPQGITLQISGMKVAFHCHKCKDRERQPPGTGQPVLRRQKGRPQVIHQHQRHGNDMKRCCTQVNAVFYRRGCSTSSLIPPVLHRPFWIRQASRAASAICSACKMGDAVHPPRRRKDAPAAICGTNSERVACLPAHGDVSTVAGM